MSKANPKTHKDMAVSRVPIMLAKRIEADARAQALSTSDVVRQILLRHYGFLKQEAKTDAA